MEQPKNQNKAKTKKSIVHEGDKRIETTITEEGNKTTIIYGFKNNRQQSKLWQRQESDAFSGFSRCAVKVFQRLPSVRHSA